MKRTLHYILILWVIAALALPFPALAQKAGDVSKPPSETQLLINEAPAETAPAAAVESPLAPTDVFTITLMHTNDFHGQMEAFVGSSSNPGIARLATKVEDIRTAVGVTNTLLLDAGDEMQGSLLSNLQKGAPVIAAFNLMGVGVATFGNHEFDWGQQVLISRTLEATYPYVSANIVKKDGADCTSSGWTKADFVDAPYVIKTVGTPPNTADIGIIGVTTPETPYITIASATEGLCFKDPTQAIQHYYNDMKTAGADAIVVLSHLGYTDGGYGYGFTVYGDQTLAANLIKAGQPADLIIGGHSHTDLSTSDPGGKRVTVTGYTASTLVTQAYYNGRQVGQASLRFDTGAGTVNVSWKTNKGLTSLTPNPAMDALVTAYTSDPAYQAKINTVVGYTAVPLVRNYNGESLMSDMIQDAVYWQLNNDPDTARHVDMVFNNAGGIRADIQATPGVTSTYVMTYGETFNVLPFGNQTVVGTMTGAEIQDLLNQSATLFKGAIQPGGIQFTYYMYTDTLPGPQPWAWGAYDAKVWNRDTSTWDALQANKTYKVATNEFLAPAGQDGFLPFKYFKPLGYYGDMLDMVNAYLTATHGSPVTAYQGPVPGSPGTLDGRITRDGTAAGGSIVPLTVLHHNDSHGNLLKGTYVGYTQLATLIKQERLHNANRTLLLNGGDSIQGDSMMYYFRTAPQGFAADGVTLPVTMTINPLIKAFNTMNYDAMTLGNHEFNFGNRVFTTTLSQAAFPVLQANIADDGRYGLAQANVQPSVQKTVGPENIKVAILGIGNHRVPNYELPSNIQGLTFTNPISTTQNLAPGLKAANDVVIALTHIGFTTNPSSVEVDANVDTNLAAQTTGVDTIIGAHSHTDPSKQTAYSGDYKYLPALVSNPDGKPVLIHHAYRYNNTLGEVVLGLRAKTGGGYEVATQAGRYISVGMSVTEDAAVKAIVDPYNALLASYNNTVLGQTTTEIEATTAYTRETSGANLQADAAVWELASHGINVDFHLSGAMSNRKVASGATPGSPVTLKISDMFTLMPYENSLVTMNMNGPQLKKVLERAYRNYYYYKYVPGQGGYSYYTTCMIDINKMGTITYLDKYPALPDGNNVVGLEFNGHKVNFEDAATYYHVSTVNYLAAGSCNFNDGGVSLWPLSQIVNDTQYYVRDAVINYIKANTPVGPVIEGRLQFIPPTNTAIVPKSGASLVYEATNGLPINFSIPNNTFSDQVTLMYTKLPADTVGAFTFAGVSFDLSVLLNGVAVTTLARPITVFVEYDEADLAGKLESDLTLSYWNGTGWEDAACGEYVRDYDLNYFSVPICHLSRFSVLGDLKYFLPFIGR